MKKIIFMSLMALLPMMSNPAMAQLGSKSEFTISAGAGTPNEKNIGEALGEAFGTAFVKSISAFITMGQVDLTDNTKKDESIGPAINLQYLYRVAPKVKVGAALSYQRSSAKLQAADNSGNYHDIAKAATDYFTVMPVVKTMWMEKEHIGLYSKAAAGVYIASNSAKMENGAKEKTPGELTDQIKSDKGTRFAYQVSAVGFEAGSKNFHCFVELGYGFQGFAQIGGSITF